MEVLPPEDALEALEVHVEVDLLELGRALVLLEQRLPFGLVQRRQRADQRLPLDDRQPGVREAGDAAHHHHGEHEGGADEKPCCDAQRDGFGHDGRVSCRWHGSDAAPR